MDSWVDFEIKLKVDNAGVLMPGVFRCSTLVLHIEDIFRMATAVVFPSEDIFNMERISNFKL